MRPELCRFGVSDAHKQGAISMAAAKKTAKKATKKSAKKTAKKK
jgi:hypothetical protein